MYLKSIITFHSFSETALGTCYTVRRPVGSFPAVTGPKVRTRSYWPRTTLSSVLWAWASWARTMGRRWFLLTSSHSYILHYMSSPRSDFPPNSALLLQLKWKRTALSANIYLISSLFLSPTMIFPFSPPPPILILLPGNIPKCTYVHTYE